MFFYCCMFLLLLKTCNTKDSEVLISNCVEPFLQCVFVHNNLRLADKLCQVDYSEKSLEWAETDTDSDSDCEL